jgi:hypothetical protein
VVPRRQCYFPRTDSVYPGILPWPVCHAHVVPAEQQRAHVGDSFVNQCSVDGPVTSGRARHRLPVERAVRIGLRRISMSWYQAVPSRAGL